MFGRRCRDLENEIEELKLETGYLRLALDEAKEAPTSLYGLAIHKRFVITMTDETTFDGLLVDSDDSVLILANARALTDPREAPTPVDGRVYLERANVKYTQELRG